LEHALNVHTESSYAEKKELSSLKQKQEKHLQAIEEYKYKEMTFKREIEYLQDQIENLNNEISAKKGRAF
jgi:peptidoglycan hydrolase CwlO-like protein